LSIEFRIDQTIQTDSFFRRAHRELSVDLRRDSHDEFSAE